MTTVDKTAISKKNHIDQPRYSVMTKDEWTPDMLGLVDSTDDDRGYAGYFGFPITSIAIDNVDSYKVYTRKHKWSDLYTSYNKDIPIGDKNPLLNIVINEPGIKYAVHCLGGGWLHPVSSGEQGGCGVPIDGIWIERL